MSPSFLCPYYPATFTLTNGRTYIRKNVPIYSAGTGSGWGYLNRGQLDADLIVWRGVAGNQ